MLFHEWKKQWPRVTWGPINTLDRQAMQRERERLAAEIERVRGLKLYGDAHCTRNNYIHWASPFIPFLDLLIATLPEQPKPDE